jgi:hypothetical protein
MRATPGLRGACAALAVAVAAGAAIAASAAGAVKPKSTRADLDAARRRAAVLESELALASTRKPYLVLDLGGKALRYRLMGMTMRDVSIPHVAVEGLETSEASPGAPSLAGIFTLKEKEGDPRLTPLSPEQVEEGADDENAANALPPEPPKEYMLTFKQPIAVEVLGRETRGGVPGLWGRFVAALRRWHGPGGGGEARLKIALHLDPEVAAEVYRSLIPDVRLLVLPPEGMMLPAAGQEAPPKPRPPRKTPPPRVEKEEPKEVPFQIPPPQDETGRPRDENGAGGEPAAEPPPAAPEGEPVPPPEPPPPPPGGGRAAFRAPVRGKESGPPASDLIPAGTGAILAGACPKV